MIVAIVLGAVACTPRPTAVTEPVATPPPPDYDWLERYYSDFDGYRSSCSDTWIGSTEPQYVGLVDGDWELTTSSQKESVVTNTWRVSLEYVRIEDVRVYVESGDVIRYLEDGSFVQVLDKDPYLERAKELSSLAPDMNVTIVATWSYDIEYDYWHWSFDKEICKPAQ